MTVGLGAVSVVGEPHRALADGKRPIEHEPIPPDPANDVAFGLRLDGDLPAAIDTPSGLVSAPDPRAPVPPSTTLTSQGPSKLAGQADASRAALPNGQSRFRPDADTSRPDALPYSEAFVPSTAPWKRLVAFDAVDADYELKVMDGSLTTVPTHETARVDGSEEQFYGDVVVDVRAGEPTRIPSVGPGARILHARLGVGAEDIDFEVVRDGAENWFIRTKQNARARLVFELTIARAVFGGPFGEPVEDRRSVRAIYALPPNVQRDASLVAATIGVPKESRHDTIEALVAYFRDFVDSNEPPPLDRGIYLGLALSKKGVCRHRAYAFMVTALGLGIRTRVVLNEAHAWVEVWDGRLWKRIDLGGAGALLEEKNASAGPPYAPPPDPFSWPPGATRGEDLARTARSGGAGGGGGAGGTNMSSADDPSNDPGAAGAAGPAGAAGKPPAPHDERPGSELTIEIAETTTPRGQPVHVRGVVTADGSPCAHLGVQLAVRARVNAPLLMVGELATDEAGAYSGVIVVPKSVGVGNYELFASTSGNDRCGGGRSL